MSTLPGSVHPRTFPHFEGDSTFPYRTFLNESFLSSFDPFLSAALPYPSFSWLIITLLFQSSIQSSLNWAEPLVSEIHSLSGLFPLISPSSHHSCSSSLRLHTQPHPPSIYLPVTFSVPSPLGLDQSIPRGAILRCYRSWEQDKAFASENESSTNHVWLNITPTVFQSFFSMHFLKVCLLCRAHSNPSEQINK